MTGTSQLLFLPLFVSLDPWVPAVDAVLDHITGLCVILLSLKSLVIQERAGKVYLIYYMHHSSKLLFCGFCSHFDIQILEDSV